jgi:hypothetical protein
MRVMRNLPVVLLCRNPTALPLPPNQRQISPHPVPFERGVSRSSRTLGAGCDGRFGAARRAALTRTGEVVWSWRPDAGVKSAEAIPPATVAKEPGHRGEHEVTVKTIAQGMSVDDVEPVVTNSSCLFTFAREAMGAARTRRSLRPLIFEGDLANTSGAIRVAGTRSLVLASLRGANGSARSAAR